MKKRRLWVTVVCSASAIIFLFTMVVRQRPEMTKSHNLLHRLVDDSSTSVGKELPLYLIHNEGCRIPDIDPLIHGYDTGKINVPTCRRPSDAPLTYIKGDRIVINRTAQRELVGSRGRIECCFRAIYRDQEGRSDDLFRYSTKCIPLVSGGVKLTSPFVRVTCTHRNRFLHSDFHAAVLKDKAVEKRCQLLSKRASHQQERKLSDEVKKQPFSVLLVGVDTMSRLNFHRFMPKTKKVLMKSSDSKMEIVEMLGYNKVLDNTFPNVVPILTGLFDSQLEDACWKDRNTSFDACQFVWHRFLDKGYRTLMAEDSPKLATFNYFKKGFFWPPVDYYLRPLMLAALFSASRATDMCVGSKLEVQIVLDWLLDFARAFASKEYFAFAWLSSLVHNVPENAQVADSFYANFFSTIFDQKLLNDTVVLFFSDHGPRWGEFRKTTTGWYEEKLPMLFVMLPHRLRKEHPRFVDQLRKNSRRLVTPFDLHQTLLDLLDLSQASRGKTIPDIYPDYVNVQQGISLFRPIPQNRTCSDALIQPHFCACSPPKEFSVEFPLVKDGAHFVVAYLNRLLLLQTNNRCAILSLSKIVSARIVDIAPSVVAYVITIQVAPSNAFLEATLSREGEDMDEWRLEGEISRINAYRGEAHCIHDAVLRKYCYCDHKGDVH